CALRPRHASPIPRGAGPPGPPPPRLQPLPAEGFAPPPGPFLDRRLAELELMIQQHGLEGLSVGLDWLCDNRPAASDSPSILHLDFHPVNIVVPRDRSPAVLDWSFVDVGDPHADAASTVL